MPFDSRPETETTIDPRVAVIDEMLALFGPRGGGWTQGMLRLRRRGRDVFCMVGALSEVCRDAKLNHDVKNLITECLPSTCWDETQSSLTSEGCIPSYNDWHTFAEIKAVLLLARERAIMFG